MYLPTEAVRLPELKVNTSVLAENRVPLQPLKAKTVKLTSYGQSSAVHPTNKFSKNVVANERSRGTSQIGRSTLSGLAAVRNSNCSAPAKKECQLTDSEIKTFGNRCPRGY